MDGVMADFGHTFYSRVFERHPHVTNEDIDRSQFYFQRAVTGVDTADLEKIITEPDFYYDHPPIEGALEAFEYMVASNKYDPYIVTSPGPFHNAPSEKFRWITEHLGIEATRRLIIARDKSVVDGFVLIDDRSSPTNEDRANWIHVLYTQPHNEHVPDKPRLTWDNWEEVLNTL